MTGQIDLHLALLLSLKDGRWRTSTDVKLHPAMERHAITHQQIGENLHYLHDLGLVHKEVHTVDGSTRMWRLNIDRCQHLTYVRGIANTGEQDDDTPPSDN